MEVRTMYNARNKAMNRGMLAGALGLGVALLAVPSTTLAGDWSLHIGAGWGHRAVRDRRVRVVRTEPRFEYQTRRIWVTPEYIERTVRVEIPAVVQERVVPIYNEYNEITGYRTVREIVREARIEYRTERTIVREGYYKTVTVRVPVEPRVRRVVHRRVRVDRGGPGLHLGFSYYKHKEHKHRAPRLPWRTRRAIRAGFWR